MTDARPTIPTAELTAAGTAAGASRIGASDTSISETVHTVHVMDAQRSFDAAATAGAADTPAAANPVGASACTGAGASAAPGAAPASDVTALRQRALELLGRGEWATCAELLETALFGRTQPCLHTGNQNELGHGPGKADVACHAAGGMRASSTDGATMSTHKELLQVLLVAKLNAEAASCLVASGCAHSAAGMDAAAASTVLRWAAVRLPATNGSTSRVSSSATTTAAATSAGDGAAADGAAAVTSTPSTGGPAVLGGNTARPLPLQGAGEVRRWFRRLAALVHPDKCRTVVPEAAAAAAFRHLQGGVEQLLQQLGVESAGGGAVGRGGGDGPHARAAKRRRDWRQDSDGDDDSFWADHVGGGSGGWGGSDAGDAAWWAEWCDGAKAAVPTTCPSNEDEEPALWEMPLQALQAEVAARQAAVLRPPLGSEAAALGIHARQRRLRVARSVLSERSKAAAAARAAAEPTEAGAGREPANGGSGGASGGIGLGGGFVVGAGSSLGGFAGGFW